MNEIIDLLMGISWSMVYIAAICLGIKNRTWCIPGLAISMNFAWEFWVVVNRIVTNASRTTAFWIQLVWLILDIGVLGTWLYFDRKGSNRLFKNLMLFFSIFVIVFFLSYQAQKWEFSVFIINIIMSAAFICQEAQMSFFDGSWFIAAGKLIGTLAATILNGFIFKNPLVLWLGGISFILDSYYLTIILKKGRSR